MAKRSDVSSDSDDLFNSFEERSGMPPLDQSLFLSTPAPTKNEEKIDKFTKSRVFDDSLPKNSNADSPKPESSKLWRVSRPNVSDSEDDDAFESYLQSLKTPAKKKIPPRKKTPIEDFIVDDSEAESEVESSCSETESPGFYRRLQNVSLDQPQPIRRQARPEKIEDSPKNSSGSADEKSDDESEYQESDQEQAENEESPTEQSSSSDSSTTKRKPAPKSKRDKNPEPSRSKKQEEDADAAFLTSLYAAYYYYKGLKDAPSFVRDFKKKKHELVQVLYELFNRRIFENELPPDLSVTWNRKLTKTAGYCALKCNLKGEKTARIELSEKVCDSAERVRDTLCHEMCHAAVWLINGHKNGGHGPMWQSWSRRVNRVFPDMPTVRRCHSYEIRAKFVYRCQGCGQEVKRHSKSLDTTKKICGKCRGRFELFVRNAQGSERKVSDDSANTRPPPKFAAFVKENYSSVKKPGLSHKDVMGLLGEKFKTKLSLD